MGNARTEKYNNVTLLVRFKVLWIIYSEYMEVVDARSIVFESIVIGSIVFGSIVFGSIVFESIVFGSIVFGSIVW